MSEALEILKSCDAFLEGHFLLSSGRHSSAYCQMAYLQQYPDRCAEVMKSVADKVKEMDVDVIVGPAMGGIVYAYELARQTGKRAIFTERVDNVMTLKRFAIHPGEKCLIAEDVVTTSSAMTHFSPGWMANRLRVITLSTRSVKMARLPVWRPSS